MTAERRRYYRIEEQVALSYQPITAVALEDHLQNFWSNQQVISARNEANFRLEQHLSDRQKIEQTMPEMARYLHYLEQQVDQLTVKFGDQASDPALTLKPTSLSAQGISFDDNLAPAIDQMLELNLKLLPTGLQLAIIARVVTVEPNADRQAGEYKISLDFEHMHEADREILIRHIHGKQMEALSNAREN